MKPLTGLLNETTEELKKTGKRPLRFTRTESLGSVEQSSTKDKVFTRKVVEAN